MFDTIVICKPTKSPAQHGTQDDVEIKREEKKMLTSQARKLNNELRVSLRRKEIVAAQQEELNEAINELELECRAAEGDVR